MTTFGPKSDEKNINITDEFYLQSKLTYDEVSAQFPRLKLEEIRATTSLIAKFISKHSKHTIIISARDNAMGRFKETDLIALKDIGVDLSGLSVRGAHVSILAPGATAINITNNKTAVSCLLNSTKFLILETL